MNIGVIGAGVVGLTTALELKKQYPNLNIKILADKFGNETTSHVAAGIFRPSTSFSGPNEEITQQWVNDAYHHWDDIKKSSQASLAGICQLSGYIYSSTSPHIVRNHLIEKLINVYRPATEAELKICPGDWKYGSYFSTILIECGLFLPWATQKLQDSGVKFIRETVHNFNDLHERFDIVMNCAGLGSKYLCKDHKLVPIRGQVLKVRAPWLKTAFFGDYDTYVIPGMGSVATLGGCRQYDSYNLEPSRYDSMAIKERCESLVPSLKGAPVVDEYVGLRPHRDPVRVEPELIRTTQGNLKVIHNYGHGGYGVTTSPGTAIYATKIFRDMQTTNSKL